MPEFPQPIEYDALPRAVMDYSTLSVIAQVARENLRDARLRRAVGLDDGSIILAFDCFREADDDHAPFDKWLISADIVQFRVHPWPDPLPEKSAQSHILEVISHHLSGAQVEDVALTYLDRVLTFRFLRQDYTGEKSAFSLIVELMGKYSNIILVDSADVILASLRSVHAYQSRVREIRAGKEYNPPPKQDRIEPREFTSSEWSDFIGSAAGDIPCDDHLSHTFLGMSNTWARSICYQAEVHPETPVNEISPDQAEKLRLSLAQTLVMVRDGIPLTGESSDDFVRRVTSDFMERAEDITLDKARLEIARIIDRRRKKLKSLESALQGDLDHAARAGDLKKQADILLANQHLVIPGMESIEVEDWETGKKVKLVLDPHLAPHMQAEAWYGRYRKLNRTAKIAGERLNSVTAEEEEIYRIEVRLAEASSMDQIDSIREECIIRGYISSGTFSEPSKDRKHSRRKKSHAADMKPVVTHRYRSNDGFLIIAGTSDRSNDALRRAASPEDIWLHVRDIPGAHVYISTRGREVPETTIREAAMVAAWHSKARDGSNVPVDYTRAKYLSPIPGGPAGKVRFKRERTVRVTPDQKRVEMMHLLAGDS